MTLHHHPVDLDSGNDSVTSIPGSHKPIDDHPHHHHHQQQVRLLCSFGGKIQPRPPDNQLRYVGGETRLVSVSRTTNFSSLHSKLSNIAGAAGHVAIRYQLPNEDLDALVTVATDEDVENMMEEIERFPQTWNPNTAVRLRLFLFTRGGNHAGEGDDSREGSGISSLLDGYGDGRKNWFLDVLNRGGDVGGQTAVCGAGGGGLKRGRSEASSVVSEMPDYLFGLECLDDPKQKTQPGFPETTGSPADASGTSPFPPGLDPGALAPVMPNLPPVKTKRDGPVGMEEMKNGSEMGFQVMDESAQESIEYTGTQPVWGNYASPVYSGHMTPPPPGATAAMPTHVYYIAGSGPMPQANAHVQSVPIPSPYFQPYQAPPGQVPIGFHPMVPGSGPAYGGPMRPPYGESGRQVTTDPYVQAARVVSGGPNQPLYYGVNNSIVVPGDITNANWMVQT